MKQQIDLEFTVPIEFHNKRIDQVAAAVWTDYSRGKLQSWIKEGALKSNGQSLAPKNTVSVGDVLTLVTQLEPAVQWQAEDIALDIIYEDEDVIVLNKPVGLVVHPAVGNWEGTLVNALLAHDASLEQLPRAGVVHRLDKDTSGVMMVARSQRAYTHLVEALQAREVSREYLAIVHGCLTGGGTVDEPIGRHPTSRQKMAVVDSGKPARTHYSISRRYRHFTELALRLETGRTHQIRVHMSHRKHPLVGDMAYGGRSRLPAKSDPRLVEAIRSFPRQALHAFELSFEHPGSGEWESFNAPIPEDIIQLQALLDEFDAP